MSRIISTSMLSADFGHLERDTKMIDASASEWIHIDVMDGVFVPNISFGFPVMKAIKSATSKFMDVHLMIVNPMKYVKRFAEAGASLITIHAEAVEDASDCLKQIRDLGVKSGISIKPATPVSAIADCLEFADLVLIMSVEPGFGGQKFIPESIEKVRELRRLVEERGTDTIIEIDGGVSADNAGILFEAGCDALVSGSSIFCAEDPHAEILKMLNA